MFNPLQPSQDNGVEIKPPAAENFGAIGDMREARKVNLADLDWSAATVVKGIGFRFIVPVPDLGNENESITVKDWKGNDKLVKGMAFQNSTDSALQAVSGDGKGVLIVAVDAEKVDRVQFAQAMFAAIDSFGGVEALNKQSLTRLIGMIPEITKATSLDPNQVPKSDVYDSDDTIAQSLTPQSGSYIGGSRPYGLYEKADKPGPLAVYVEGNCEVSGGPHASAARYEQGFMAVQIAPKKEGGAPSYRSIAPEAVSYCYVLADGSPIRTANLSQV